MKRAEITSGKTYSNAKGTIHRKVKAFHSNDQLQDPTTILFEVTVGRSKRYNGESGSCTLGAFCQWAKFEV